MKRIAAIIVTAALGFTLAGCSGTSAESGAPTTAEPAGPAKDEVKIDELSWSAEMGAENGMQHMMFSYTNNSDETIVGFDLEMGLKADAETEAVESAFSNVLEQGASLENVQNALMHGEGTFATNPGATSKPDALSLGGSWYVINPEQYELMEPKELTIQFLRGSLLYTEYYDFESGSYTLDTNVVDTSQWSDSELASLLPRPEGELVTDVRDYADQFSFDTASTAPEGFDAYVEACKAAGFTQNVANTDTTYYADSEDGGYSLDLFYWDNGTMTAYITPAAA